MAGSTRIKGKALGFQLGTPAVDYWADHISVALDNEEKDSDIVTFADVAGGGARQFFLEANAVSSTGTDSFWRYVWEHSGETQVPFIFAPHGNEDASPEQPHFTGMCTIGAKPKMGTEADQTSDFEVRFDIDGVPVLDDGS